MHCKLRFVYVSAAVLVGFFFVHTAWSLRSTSGYHSLSKQERYPLVWKYVHESKGHGGAWYIPPEWLSNVSIQSPTNITHAARLAAELADSSHSHLSHSTIPLIIHQTWKSTNIDSFPNEALAAMETWLQYAVHPELPNMAYFMWEDDGIMDLMSEADPNLLRYFDMLPKFVEKTDIFRIVVCNMIGGVYADVDTMALRPPLTWIQSEDLTPWTDPQTNTSYSPDRASDPVGLILGLEADNPDDSDSFWRMGYLYPVQLTQWALASTANHAVLGRVLRNFQAQMKTVVTRIQQDPNGGSLNGALEELNPILLTGPAAVTAATKDHLEERKGLRWQALSGIEDGGRSKIVEDTLILPITGFSPGRGRHANMGSKAFSHPDARVRHNFQGSWKKIYLMGELRKACRTFLGRCKPSSEIS